MPVLELLEPDGSLSPFAPANLLAVTMYPEQKHEAKREELLVSVAVQLLLQLKAAETKPKKGGKGKRRRGEEQEKAVVSVPMDWLSVVLRSPSADKIIEDAAAYAAYSWVAGELIMFMLSAAIHHPAHDVTLTKAVWAFPALFGGAETYGSTSLSVSLRTVWTAWSRFKSVAHLHAIRQIWLEKQGKAALENLGEFVNLHNDQILDYLANAEAIRRGAVERKILKHGQTWWPPESLKLPPARVEVPPLPQPALEELAKYVPEYSKDVGQE